MKRLFWVLLRRSLGSPVAFCVRWRRMRRQRIGRKRPRRRRLAPQSVSGLELCFDVLNFPAQAELGRGTLMVYASLPFRNERCTRQCTRNGAGYGLDFSSVRANSRQRYRSVPSASGCWVDSALLFPRYFDALCIRSAHFQAVETISSSDRLAFQLRSFSARLGSATSSA